MAGAQAGRRENPSVHQARLSAIAGPLPPPMAVPRCPLDRRALELPWKSPRGASSYFLTSGPVAGSDSAPYAVFTGSTGLSCAQAGRESVLPVPRWVRIVAGTHGVGADDAALLVLEGDLSPTEVPDDVLDRSLRPLVHAGQLTLGAGLGVVGASVANSVSIKKSRPQVVATPSILDTRVGDEYRRGTEGCLR